MIKAGLIIAAAIASYVGALSFYYRKRFPPLFNIVLGKATFEALSPDRKQAVRDRAIQIINRNWQKGEFAELNFCDEAHRFSWYALAMAELGIPPYEVSLGISGFLSKSPTCTP